jgi:hypothetical protein
MTQFICNVKADSHKVCNRNISVFKEYTNVLRHYSRNTFYVTFLHNNSIKIYKTEKIKKKCIYIRILIFVLVYPNGNVYKYYFY